MSHNDQGAMIIKALIFLYLLTCVLTSVLVSVLYRKAFLRTLLLSILLTPGFVWKQGNIGGNR